ncbi:MAG TPA: 1-acyl-sn-glycerol-3-phosphate acyltransferase [Anaeromyxobacteraceae bacterium]|nr:1-acyl-sn-glycerol-3-phosphate acyltransferase [Anaeromyxobacteraceae bacterium]
MEPSAPGATAPEMDHELLHRIVPVFRALVRLGYFSFEVHGAEHLPADGRAVYAANHAGWFPLDAFFTGLAVSDALGEDRTPFFAASDTALALPGVGAFLRRMGALPASWFRRPERLPPGIDAFGIFPEGVEGNCKPFWEAYRLRTWNRGFVRVAVARELPIVPVAVFGGEECLPVAWTVRALEPIVGSIFGLPLCAVPLPARWKVVFHPPVRLEARGRTGLADAAWAADVAQGIRRTVQATLDAERDDRVLARLSHAVAERLSDSRGAPDAGAARRRARRPRRRAPALRVVASPT